MYDFLIKNARLVSGECADIAIQNGKIAAIGELADAQATKTLTLNNDVFVSAGWIDGHTHCYPNSPIYNDEPDAIGVTGGVTTVIDAGSTGADDVDDFAEIAKNCKTEVRALLNISRIGLLRQNELADKNDIDLTLAKNAVERHPDFVVGLKARMSGSVVGENGLTPLKSAKALQCECGCLPLMVHVGNAPPTLDDIAELLGEGDILTHCFNGKPNRILTPEGKLRDAVKAAMERGMLLDIGHGSASFSFDVAEMSIAQGILPDTISSDIYCKNRINGPVYGLAHLMSMFFTLGLSHEQIIERVTTKVARALRLETKGQLVVGCDADLTLYNIEHAQVTFTDTEGDTRTGEQRFAPLAAIVGGEMTLTEKGQTHHVFNS
ncbi:amidohydrolase/deacetylase family metallohydrolase [Enterovibrio coralii]|uniref:Dihydroorotase n=1 Tax=Enterovibrio coralii TaxID=294935 RepID=A0A135I446_9GAMM|nr:amidohydrolase/deacetylase family metallohydrolase [Enterovibrio coralii]KXF80221.1 dihydroorotase [Enterovibrio coralii]